MTYRFLTMAVYLNSRGLAFVVFEGELAPLDWSVVEARGSDRRETLLARVETLFKKLRPNVLVLENMSDPEGRPPRIRRLNEAIVQLAKRYTLQTVFFTRTEVRQQFAYLGTVTKDAVAMAIAKHIPAFERFLPSPRKPWKSEDARMGIFDAAALALTFFQSNGHLNQSQLD
jgi:hypothetical protein